MHLAEVAQVRKNYFCLFLFQLKFEHTSLREHKIQLNRNR